MKHEVLMAAVAFGVFSLAGCGGGGGSESGSSTGNSSPQAPEPPAAPAHQFVDVTAGSGISFEIGYRNVEPVTYLTRFATGAVAAGDYDSDGDIDLFITRGDIGANLLYRNNGQGVFTDVARAAGVDFTANDSENYRHSGATFADMDGDGHLDLFISGLLGDPSKIYRNNGDGTFADVTAGSGIDEMISRENISAAFGDYDLDGDIDLAIGHWGTERDVQDPGETEHLWRNESSGSNIVFTSVSVEAGISPSILTLPDPHAFWDVADYTFTPTFARIDDDLYPDLLMVADGGLSQYFRNYGDGTGTFYNATNVEVITDRNGMGSAVGDYDNDGDLDWFVTSISTSIEEDVAEVDPAMGNRFYENVAGLFRDETDDTNVGRGGWGWGACFMDFENDGDLDIFHTNGWEDGYEQDESRAYVSDGAGSFEDQAASLGLDDQSEGRGVVCADFDNDGDVDIFQMHRGSPVSARLWRNDASSNNWLRVRLQGRSPNTEASGARIYATVNLGMTDERTMMREISIGSNFQSQNPTLQIFGLGQASQVDELTVQWPDGGEVMLFEGQAMNALSNVAAGQTLTLIQPPL